MFRIIAAAALVLGASQSVWAVDHRIDRRTYTDASGSRYYVIITARGGWPTGHAYVTWAREDARARQCVVDRSYGFYPVSTIRVAFGDTPGQLEDEALKPTGIITDRLIVEVNRPVYYNSMSPINTWATTNYNLFKNNCISFTRDVASYLRITIPPRNQNDYPSDYVQRLIKANPR